MSISDHTKTIDYLLRVMEKFLQPEDTTFTLPNYIDCCVGIAEGLTDAVNEVVTDGHIARLDLIRKHMPYKKIQQTANRRLLAVGVNETTDFAMLLNQELPQESAEFLPSFAPEELYSSRDLMFMMLFIGESLLQQAYVLGHSIEIPLDEQLFLEMKQKIDMAKQKLVAVQ